MRKNFVKIWLVVFLLMASLVLVSGVRAGSLLPPETNHQCAGVDTSNCGNYTLNDFLKLAVRIIQFIWGISGGLALLFFIYGGFIFLTSAGNTERIAKGKQTIINSVIGLIVIFGSWAIINFVFKSLGVNTGGVGWNVSSWFR